MSKAMKALGWLTNDPEVAHRLRLADAWYRDQRLRANRAAFDADRAKRAAIALAKKAEADRREDYDLIFSETRKESP